MDFKDICKLVKSNDSEFIINFDNDCSGTRYYAGGFEITTEVNGKNYTWDLDLFPLGEDCDDWDEAKNYFSDSILSFDDFYSNIHEKYKLTEEDEIYQELKTKMLRVCKIIVSQIESIAESNNIDLDEYFSTGN